MRIHNSGRIFGWMESLVVDFVRLSNQEWLPWIAWAGFWSANSLTDAWNCLFYMRWFERVSINSIEFVIHFKTVDFKLIADAQATNSCLPSESSTVQKYKLLSINHMFCENILYRLENTEKSMYTMDPFINGICMKSCVNCFLFQRSAKTRNTRYVNRTLQIK